ncbi:hypothetical protein [Streptomyces sp. TLI_171]|uniref:hypothetical protein n=1 Tax=Streptomyces sp. TLI_171 TaxID=1938859 RepID=UPI000C17908C|nr:hypothetical protein [Streptomyces sp. TLI_171]RKE23533.1 hypothetical protein BX266_7005 [Streptomyces sp. TLI_171]
MTLVEKVEQRLAGELLPGEQVLYGVLGFRIGGIRTTMIGGAAGIAGGAGIAAMTVATSGATADVPAAQLPVPARSIVALTDQRLMVFSIGGLFVAKPKKILHSYALDQIAGIPEPELVPGAAQALRVHIGVAGAGVLAVEFPRLQVSEARNMVRRIERGMSPQA